MSSSKLRIKNHGFLLDERTEKDKGTDYLFGASPIPLQILQDNSDWENYLPTLELQRYTNPDGSNWDNMSCVTYSALNCIEILYKRKFGSEQNFSDRFISKMSGTTPNGNSFFKVADTIRHVGLVPEEDWDDASITPPMTWDKYQAAIPKDVIAKGKDFLKMFTINYEFFGPRDSLLEALKYSPVQVAANWNAVKNSAYGSLYYASNPNNPYTHAITLFRGVEGKFWEIFDHYERDRKKVVWEYKFGFPMRYDIIKNSDMLSLEFIKSKARSTIYALIAGQRVFPLMDPQTFFDISAEKEYKFKEVTELELKNYMMMPKLFTLSGLFKVLTG